MGSLGGHMMHLWEDRSLSFGDIKEIINQTCSGNLRATEKFDGINIHFRVDSSGELRYARNGNDQQSGGLTQAQFSKLMENHPASQTFVDGSEALYRLARKSFWPLGFSGRNWINCDIINKHRPMTIDYDECAVVFHGVKNFSGIETSPALHESFLKYANDCSSYSVVVNENEWRVSAPVEVFIPDLRGTGILSNFESSLLKIMQVSGCNEESTVEDFARYMVYEGFISPLGLSTSRSEKLLSHIFQDGGTRLVDIKKGLPPGLAKKVSEVGSAKNRMKVIGESVMPLEIILTYAGAQVLESISSSMVDNPAQEKNRLAESIEAAELICEIYSDEYSAQRSTAIKKYIEKFNSCGRIIPAIEGVVFESQGSQYKLTGNFAPINHILGIPRYGRGKIPPVDQKYNVQDVIKEIDLIKNMTTF